MGSTTNEDPLEEAVSYLFIITGFLIGMRFLYIAQYPDNTIVRECLEDSGEQDEPRWESKFKEEIDQETFDRDLERIANFDFALLTEPVPNAYVAVNSSDTIYFKESEAAPGKGYNIDATAKAVYFRDRDPWWQGTIYELLIDEPLNKQG